jgi:hypothetical protein
MFRRRQSALLREITMKRLILLAAIAFGLVASTAVLTTVHPQSAVACATQHCGCENHPKNAVDCRE